jgi:hypothetical protein
MCAATFLPAPLTARAVGTISKQAGLSVPESEVGIQQSEMVADTTSILEYENQCLSRRQSVSQSASSD